MTLKPPGMDYPHILLVNPWIHDFAAYDVWAKPYGLLSLAAVLQSHGFGVSFVDCLDRFHPKDQPSDPHARHGRGPYRKCAIAPPKGLERTGRIYSRYGIDPTWLRHDLKALGRPDMVMVTSLMTYWYPGVVETIKVIKKIYPDVPVILGGIYARLCSDHARRHSGADEVVVDRGESILDVIERHTGVKVNLNIDLSDMDAWPYPAFDLQRQMSCVPLLTTRGCPYACDYCASHHLEPAMTRRSPDSVVGEIEHWHCKYGVIDFAFYDDAFLVDSERHAIPILEGIEERKWPIYFHTPNAVHIRSITRRVAGLMKRAGFHTLRLGLETTAFETRSGLDRKVTEAEFSRAVGNLKRAGFEPSQIGAYLLVGLPGQSVRAVETSIDVVKAGGITPVLAYYTPIPHTPLWQEAVASSRYDLAADPVFCNNAILPCRQESFSWSELSRLKNRVQR